MDGVRRRGLDRAAPGAVRIRRPHLVSALATKWHPLLHTKSALRWFRNIPRARHANIFAMKLLFNAVLFLALAPLLPAAKNLEIYFIDVEGGQATLMMSPGGESMLIDTGWGGFNRRDAERIAAAAKKAGVKRIDYLVISHFHTDHVGGVAQLSEKLPIRNFIDHGANVETDKPAEILFKSYAAQRQKGNHIQVKPGDTIPVKDLEVRVVSAGGQTLTAPL